MFLPVDRLACARVIRKSGSLEKSTLLRLESALRPLTSFSVGPVTFQSSEGSPTVRLRSYASPSTNLLRHSAVGIRSKSYYSRSRSLRFCTPQGRLMHLTRFVSSTAIGLMHSNAFLPLSQRSRLFSKSLYLSYI